MCACWGRPVTFELRQTGGLKEVRHPVLSELPVSLTVPQMCEQDDRPIP